VAEFKGLRLLLLHALQSEQIVPLLWEIKRCASIMFI